MDIRTLVLFLFVTGLTVQGCGSSKSSPPSSGTQTTTPTSPTGDDTATTAKTARRTAALTVLSANCISCHTAWSDFSTDAQWQDNGVVQAGHADQSELITMLKNVGGSMPRGGSALSDSDYQALRSWINGM